MSATKKTQRQLLEEILDKTNHVRGALMASDMEIVIGCLDERERLIGEYAAAKFGKMENDCRAIAQKITALNETNDRELKKLMKECGDSLSETRKKIQELKTGKKANAQYHGAAAANMGAVFDFKR